MKTIIVLLSLFHFSPACAVEANYFEFHKTSVSFIHVDLLEETSSKKETSEANLVEELREIIEDCLINCNFENKNE